MANWPATLPQSFLVQGFSEMMPNNVIRSKMDVGPPKVRRRSTAAPTELMGRQAMTLTQTETLDTFYKDTTAYGSQEFTWDDPRTGDSVSMRFKAPPKLTALGNDYWMVEFQMEILP
jgi:hypothetical protein